jgi:hypothetical protein
LVVILAALGTFIVTFSSFGILAAVAIAVVVIPRYQNAQLCEGRANYLGCIGHLQDPPCRGYLLIEE